MAEQRRKTQPAKPEAGLGADLERLNRRLRAEAGERRRLEEILRSLPHQILLAQDTERRRVAAELHDGVNQLLGSAKFRLLHVEGKMAGHPEAETLVQARELVERALVEVRRISHHMRPSELDDFGLAAAVEGLVRGFEARTKIKVTLQRGAIPKRFPPQVELAIYRILQEALANVEQHAGARHVTVSLLADAAFATLHVQDDGHGFVPGAKPLPDQLGRGLGLINMRERAQAHGGVFAVKSAPGRGAEISVHVKLQP